MDVWFEGITIPVSDLGRSIDFYTAVGFAVEIHVERFALLRFGTGTVGLLSAGPRLEADTAAGTNVRAFVQIEMGTDALDELHADLVARGVPVHLPPRDRGFERHMQLRDPDGFTVEFAEGERGRNATG